LDTRLIEPREVADMIRATSTTWVQLLSSVPDVRKRPAPQIWSPLEYACHVRDVFVLYDQRLQLMLTENNPIYQDWDQDQTAVEEHYPEQDPAQVSVELQDAGSALAWRFDQVEGQQWSRPGRRSDGAEFTIASFARYLIHDVMHHVYDVTGQLQQQTAPG
jgi:hypothetical protein